MAETKIRALTAFARMEPDDFEEIVFIQNRRIGLRAIICIHDTRHGPAHGGIRRIRYPSDDAALADVMRLAHAMSRKAAIANIPSGGGKAVIIDHPGLNRRAAYETIGRFVERMGGRFFTGPDVGTGERDLAAVRKHTSHVVAKQVGEGSGQIAAATARGVIHALQATLRQAFGSPDPSGRAVAVQGLGEIGERVADWLYDRGAELIVTDIDKRKLGRWRGRTRVQIVAPGKMPGVRCDLFSPNALGGIITAKTRLQCRAVCGSANNPLVDDAAARGLHRQGVLFAPDFLVNAGGLIEGASLNLGFHDRAEKLIEQIGTTLRRIYQRSARDNQPPYTVALQMADAKLRAGKSPSKFTMHME